MSNVPKAADETLPRGSNDSPSEYDTLGFSPYITALRRFLLHADPPLTISIQGEWGAGKSSFMQQLQHRLEDAHFTVWFNPWQYQKEEELWAAFILQFIEQVTAEQSTLGRLRARLSLLLVRSKERRNRTLLRAGIALGLYAVVVLGIVGFVTVFAEVRLVQEIGTQIVQLLGVLGVTAASGVGLLVWLKRNVVERTENELRSYHTTATYADRVSFIQRFHTDFEQILNAYVGERRVFVFIDDLDRCDQTKVGDLVETLHLMLAVDRRVVFLLGMDREIVTGALEAKHADIIETLDEESKDTFGDRYLEKFIQIPFVIPRITSKSVDEFVDGITDTTADWPPLEDDYFDYWDVPFRYKISLLWERFWFGLSTLWLSVELWLLDVVLALLDHGPGDQQAPPPTVWDWSQSRLKTMTELAAPILDYNPRQLKRFVNLYSLSALLSSELEPFRRAGRDSPGTTREPGERRGSVDSPELEQIGKFVVITLRWPWFLRELQRNPKLLSTLTLIGLRRRYWSQYRDKVAEELDTSVAGTDATRGTDGDVADSFLNDEGIRTAEVETLPEQFQSEKGLAPMLELLLAAPYTGETTDDESTIRTPAPPTEEERTDGESVTDPEQQRVDEFEALLRTNAGTKAFDEQVNRFRDPTIQCDGTWFFETLGPKKIAEKTGAKLEYTLAHEKTVRNLLEVSPRSSSMDEDQYQLILEYRRQIDMNPNAPWLRVDLATLLVDFGHFDEAEREFETALDLDPDDVYALINYAKLLEATGRPAQAADRYEAALRHGPTDSYIYVDYADLLLSQGRLDEAVSKYETALQHDPYNIYARLHVAEYFAEQDNLEKAEANYREAEKLAPEDGVVLASYASFLADCGRHPEAEKRFQEAVDLLKAVNHNHYDAYVLTSYANFLADRDRALEAGKLFQRVLEMGDEDVYFQVSYAEFLAEQNRPAKAETHYQRWLDRDPTDETLLVSYAAFLSDREREDEVIALYEQALAHDPESASLHNEYGTFLDEQGRTEDALEQFRAGLELDPDHALLNNNYGYLLAKQGQVDEAEWYCRKAVDLDPKSPYAHDTLAFYLHQAGEHADAAVHYQRAIALDPDDPDYHRSYADLLEDQGRTEAADQERQRAQELEAESAAQN